MRRTPEGKPISGSDMRRGLKLTSYGLHVPTGVHPPAPFPAAVRGPGEEGGGGRQGGDAVSGAREPGGPDGSRLPWPPRPAVALERAE